MNNKVELFEIPIDNIDMKEAIEKALVFLNSNSTNVIYTPNSEILMLAKRDSEFKSILKSAQMLLADGAGVVIGSRILKKPLPERIAGFDFTKKLFDLSCDKPISFFFLGGKEGVAVKAAENVSKLYPNIKIAGCRSGYFTSAEEPDIINEINSLNTDILLVGLGAPKQEKWIYSNKSKLNCKICIGIGGSFDILSGNTNRAPEFFQKNSLEWLYRLYKEPSRYKRTLELPKFLCHIFVEKIKGTNN